MDYYDIGEISITHMVCDCVRHQYFSITPPQLRFTQSPVDWIRYFS